MVCPDCQHELQAMDCKGVQIQECAACKGKWFERDQLQKAEASADDTLRWLDFDPFGQDAEALSVAAKGKVCPRCSGAMASLQYMQSSIVIDKCAQCHGVWLEAGELKKIIRYLKDLVDNTSAQTLAKESFREFIRLFSGRKDMLSEVKDLLAVLFLLELRISVDHPDLAGIARKIYENTPFR